MKGSVRIFVAFCAALLMSAPALGDDLADEADLQFQLGAQSYQRGDYEGALEHFLASNRLVPNRNVVFNIARSYEKLTRYPEAYRYYTQALDGETDPAAAARIEAALAKISQNVAVLDIASDPPGATIYLDRRDLGPRGNTPRKLGMAPGRYKVIVELPGHLPAETVVEQSKAGVTTPVRLTLKPILGTVQFDAEPGTVVHAGTPDGPARCQAPCALTLPPGRHLLFASRPGHRNAELFVDVLAHRTVTVRPVLEALTGTLVVGTDEPGALIEIDGRPRGFTPAILTVTAGEHHVALQLRGFRPLERRVTVPVDGQARLDATLTRSDEVIAASRVVEEAENAPSSVTIVPRREIVTLAYPNIGEALRGVRGVYLWDDRHYATIGIRGLGRLGGYGNRVLVLYDGHPINDNWIGSSFTGFDARTDLADVERIEVVRGPGSALYGANAFSGVINVVTRYRDVPPGAEVGVSTALDGVARARARADARLGKDSGMWASMSVGRSRGRDFFFPEFVAATPPDVAGHARNVDGFTSGTLQGRAYWKWLTVQYFGHSYTKHLPAGAFETLIGDERTRQRDARAFVEARADPEISRAVALMTRLHWNHYRFNGYYARDPMDFGLEVDTFRGSWVGLEQRVIVGPSDPFRLTLGVEGQHHYEVEQQAYDDAGFFLDDTDREFQVGAAYGVVDADVARWLRASLGARVDVYSTFGASVNPRAALIVRPYEDGSTKLLVGRAFRAPSIYELYYNDDGFTQVAAADFTDLNPEVIYSVELEHTHRFSPTVSSSAAVFSNYVTDLIGTSETDPFYYVNSTTPLVVVGGEIELRRDWRQGWMVGASYTLQHARFIASESADDLFALRHDPNRRKVSNVPSHMGSLKGAVPIIGRALTAATRLSAEGPRYDRFEEVGSDPQRQTDGAVLWDLVLSGEESRFGMHYALGVYNAFDWRYALPVSEEFEGPQSIPLRSIEQNGRTFLASVDVRF